MFRPIRFSICYFPLPSSSSSIIKKHRCLSFSRSPRRGPFPLPVDIFFKSSRTPMSVARFVALVFPFFSVSVVVIKRLVPSPERGAEPRVFAIAFSDGSGEFQRKAPRYPTANPPQPQTSSSSDARVGARCARVQPAQKHSRRSGFSPLFVTLTTPLTTMAKSPVEFR